MTQAQVFLAEQVLRGIIPGVPFSLKLPAGPVNWQERLTSTNVRMAPELLGRLNKMPARSEGEALVFVVRSVASFGLTHPSMSDVRTAGFRENLVVCPPDTALVCATQLVRGARLPGGRILVIQKLLDCPRNLGRYIMSVTEDAKGLRTAGLVSGSPKVLVRGDDHFVFRIL